MARDRRLTRRTFFAKATLPGLGWLAARSLAWAETTDTSSTPKSLILIWLDGGPSQLETFDPHPGGAIGGPTRAIATATPGLCFAAGLEPLAELSNDMAVVRSLVSKEGDHARGQYALRTGYRPDPTVQHPSMGAIAAHELPGPGVDLPPYISILSTDRYSEGGRLGSAYQAYKMGDPADPPRNLTRLVDKERLASRLSDLDVIEAPLRARKSIPHSVKQTQDQVEQAVRMMQSDQRAAFEVFEEPQSVLQAYGQNPLGRGCIAARRLVERGVRAVEVQLGGWDSHTDNFETHAERVRILAPALASLLRDLKARGLLETTLVVCCGEFGRTPRINFLDGRDHWPKGFSAVLAGAGVPGGTVWGATDPEGVKPPESPVSVADFTATILRILGVDPTIEYTSASGRPIKLSEGNAIDAILPRSL